jgi:type I restriction enzyme S subunit
MSELPSSWTSCCLDDLFQEIKNGTTQKQNKDGIGYPVSRIETIQKGRFDLTRIQHIAEVPSDFVSLNRYEVGDIAFSHINSLEHVGKTSIYEGVPENFIHGMNLLRMRPKNSLLPKFLYYQLNTKNVREAVRERVGHAVNQVSINQTNLRQVPMVLAPLNEQKRIVAKLDELLPKVEACKQRLEEIPTILKRFRQSVLADAVSGRLTEQWRRNQGIEDDTIGLPGGWKRVVLRDVVDKFNYGSSAKSERKGKIPVLRMGNIQNGEIDWSDLVYSNDDDEIKKYLLTKNTVLFNRTNSPELVGKTAIYRGERPAIVAGYLIRAVTGAELNAEYLNLCLNAPDAREWCREVKSDGVSQSNINAQKLADYKISLPPLKEQEIIVKTVREHLLKIELVVCGSKKALTYAAKVSDAILSKAFSGSLVDQDPSDEPASSLLERIKASSTPKPKKSAPKKRKAEKEEQSLSA